MNNNIKIALAAGAAILTGFILYKVFKPEEQAANDHEEEFKEELVEDLSKLGEIRKEPSGILKL